jgi:pimeloyl-ACP methyl ester carboxylesterase
MCGPPVAVAEKLHSAIRGSTLVVLPDAGHLCNIEAADAFNDAVRSFLHGVAAAPRPGVEISALHPLR